MKIRLIEFEGTAEELNALPELQRGLSGRSQREGDQAKSSAISKTDRGSAVSLASEEYGGIPTSIVETLARRSRTQAGAEFMARFIDAVASWEGVIVKLGHSSKSDDGYAWNIRLHRKGSELGAFALVDARHAYVIFRLGNAVLSQCRYAFERDVRPQAPYRIKLQFDSAEALDEALLLGKEAYEEVMG
jgi:hypothetical protein